jgi:DNA polymerase-1
LIAFDTETDGLHGPLTVASFADGGSEWTEEPNLLYMPENCTLAGHHLSYDLRTLLREGKELGDCALFDTAVAEHLLDETEPFPDLGVLAGKYLGRTLGHWDSVKDDPAALREYARQDARATYDIARIQWGLLEEQGLLDYFLKIEMPLVPIIADMEHRGIRLDRGKIQMRADRGAADILLAEEEIKKILHDYNWACRREGCVEGMYHWKRGDKVVVCTECDGTGINPVVLTSGDYQVDILYNHLGLPELPGGRTKKGNKLSTDKDILPRLRSVAIVSGNHRAAEYIDALLGYRKVKKLDSTYYGPWAAAQVDRLNPTWNQTGAATGRWSSSGPNFQNIPPEARDCMIPDEGCAFISVDYTQIELYLLGVLSGEQAIVDAYESGQDMHQATADMAGVDRARGKMINFGLVYGLGAESLAEKLNCIISEASEIYSQVHSKLPKLNAYKARVINDAKRLGYSSTILGRRRRLPMLHSKLQATRGRAERQAVNHTIQGSAGDLIKCAMIKTVLHNAAVMPVMQIHDEVIWQVKGDVEDAEYHAKDIKWCFENANKMLNPRAEAVVMPDCWAAK